MAFSVEINGRVPFHDLDPMMIVWHGNYLKYFDQARFALFDAAGIDLYGYMMDRQFVFPITRTSTKYIQPLRANDNFSCKATVTEAHNKIAMEFEIRRSADGALCARATSEQLAVKMPDMALEFEIPIDIQRAFGFAE
jgi:acyl-CoA thioester hydrolase